MKKGEQHDKETLAYSSMSIKAPKNWNLHMV